MIAPVVYITVDTIRTGQKQGQSADQKGGGDYTVTSIPLSDLVKEGDVTISSNQVNINGQLKINNSFVLTPGQAPTNPLSGQFYFSQDSNQLYYYNGTQFVDVATGAQITQLNSTIASNSFESLSLGAGLERVGAQLVNTGILALPQDLAVTATPSFGGLNLGSALSVGNGGTGATSAADARINLGAAASGANGDITSLTALTAVSPTAGVTYQFAPAVSGTYDFCTTAGNCATAGAITGSGTSGRLAKFTSGQVIADSLLSESGSVVTANGDLRVTQSMAVGNAGSIQDSGPVQVTFDASQNYSNTTGLTHVDGLNARINVSDTSSSALTVTGAYNEAIINRSGNFAGWGYGSYSYLENGTSGNTNDINGSVSQVWNFSSGTTSIGTGLSALYKTDSGLTDWAYGGRSYVSASTSGSINNAIGLNSRIENFGNGTIANGYGVLVQSASNASGLFQNNYGMYIQDQSGVGSVSSFNLYSAGASSKNNIEGSLQVGATSTPSRLNVGTTSDTTAAGGITLGGDTNLYRSAANTIKTDDSIKIQTAANSAQAFQVQDAGGLNVLNVDTITHDITTDNGNLYINALDTVNPTLTSSGTGGTLAAGTYYYRVSAYKAGGQLSGAIDTTPSSATTTGSTSRNTLSWPAVSGAAGYYIYRSADGGSTYRRVDVGTATSAIDNGTNYTWSGGDYSGDRWFNFTGNIYLEHGAGVNFNSGAAQIAEDLRGELEIANYNSGSLVGGVAVYSDYFGVYDTTEYHTNLYMDNTGKTSFANRVDSTSGFEIQNAAYQNVFTVDTSNQRIAVGPAAVPANSVLTVGSNTTAASGGITLGTDTNLYRSAANTLKTDDSLQVVGAGAYGNTATVNNSGTERNTLSVKQSYTSLTGINYLDNLASSLTVNADANSTTPLTANYNELYAQGTKNYGKLYGGYSYAESDTSGTIDSLIAQEGYAYNYNSSISSKGVGVRGVFYNEQGTVVDAIGLQGSAGSAAGSNTNSIGIDALVRNNGAGTVTNGYGLRVQSAVNDGGGVFTNNYGVYIQDQSAVGSANSYNLYSAGANSKNYLAGKVQVGSSNTASRVNIGADTDTTSAGGITFGTDTNLYRGAANQLKTDDDLLVRTGTNSTTAFQIQNASGTPLLTADTTNMTITVQALAVTGNLTVNGHLVTGGSTPSTSVNANAGVGATCTVSGTDTAGTITVTTGSSGVVAGTQCTVSFSSSFGAAPRVVVGPSNSAAGPLDPYIGSTATNNFTVGVGTAGSTATAYKFDYVAAQ